MQKGVKRRGKSNKLKTKKGKKGFTRNKKIATCILGIIIILIGYLYVTQWYIPNEASGKPLSILIVGTDVDTYRDETFSGKKPQRTDAIVAATFNPNTYKMEMTSIPRDTAVDYVCDTLTDPVLGEVKPYRGPINDLYELSGHRMDCLSKTVEKFLNLPIDYYIKFDLSEASEIIDQIGGIEITAHAADGSFCQSTTSGDNSYCFKDGENFTMMGDEAIQGYARFRKDSEFDQGRGIRQQQVVMATMKKMLKSGFNMSTIQTIFGVVDTNMQAKLMYDYLIYFDNISKVSKMIDGSLEPDVNAIPKSAWIRIMQAAGYNNLIVSQNSVEDFIRYVLEEGRSSGEFFVTNHQFFNEQSSIYFLAPDDQRLEISNSLRINKELPRGKPAPYEYKLGKSNLPFDEDLNGGGIVIPPEELPEPTTPNDPSPPIDKDGDGVPDVSDVCDGFDDKIDVDNDGIPDGCDDFIDSDSDGVADKDDICNGFDDKIDVDNDGIPDGCDDIIDSDSDGVADK
ncbi:MAG: LCP family protein, partial [Mycoplasmatales bacterium]